MDTTSKSKLEINRDNVSIPYISIVIPVYNGLSNGLEKCLNAIWQQPIDKELYEVICVDDCSTDGTHEWLSEQSKEHDNLRIIFNEKNIRQGGSRNNGFRAAKGKYIALVDQDDYYHHDALKRVYDHLKDSDLDLLIVDCAYQSPGKESNILQHNFPHLDVMTGDEMIVTNSIPYAPWKFIFSRQMILDNDLFFAENERIEDVDWVHVMTHYAKRAQYQPILFVHYNKTPFSTTMTSYKTPITTYSTLRLSRRLAESVDTTFKDSSDEVKRHMANLSSRFLYLGLRNYFFINDSVKNKTDNIQYASLKVSPNGFFANYACSKAKIFSIITNISAPFDRFLMKIYRYIKYR